MTVTDRFEIGQLLHLELVPERRTIIGASVLEKYFATLNPNDAAVVRAAMTGENALLKSVVIRCGNGLAMSVWTGKHAYCQPRDSIGPWTHVEIGFPSYDISRLLDRGDPESEIHGYVPIEKLVDVILAAGGLVIERIAQEVSPEC